MKWFLFIAWCFGYTPYTTPWYLWALLVVFCLIDVMIFMVDNKTKSKW